MIIHGNAFELLPEMGNSSIDLVITDPPYDFKPMQKLTIHNELLRICKGTIIVFSPPENQWILPANQYLFWIKPISTKNTSKKYSRFVEMLFVYGSGEWVTGRHWSQYTNVFMDLVDNSNLHPFRKPPSLIERLILNHSVKGDTILDPFAGSGVISEVAERTGRNCISMDISND